MGLSALRKVLAPEPCTWRELRGTTVAVDANNLLWSFVTGMARGGAPTGSHGRPISHVLGLSNRLRTYAERGVASIWVFDGEQPALKEDTLRERHERIEAAREAGDEVAGTRLEREQVHEAQALLSACGVPWTVAPGESDAQCAELVRAGHADAAVTQDYDAALHGSPLTYRNLTTTGKRDPERMELAAALEREGITREQLVDAAILIGTDYNDGIRGIGPVTALKLVREHEGLEAILEAREVEMPEASAVRRLFLEHPVDHGFVPQPGAPDPGQVAQLMGEHGLSRDRAAALVGALQAIR